MSTVNNGPQIVKNGLIACLDAGNNRSYSTNRFQSLGTGLITENVTFAINGTGTFQRVASGTVIGGYTVRPNDVVYSYVLGVNGCHYHGNSAPIPSGVYATFSVDYLITGATNIATSYPNNVVLVYENYGGSALAGSTSLANNYQNIWQRLTLTSGPTAGVGTQAMFLYPGYCAPGKLADSGTIYFRNPRVEWTNVDNGNGTFSSTSNIGIWYDLSGNGYNGTLTNGPTSNVSNKGNILFDGTDDYVSITANSNTRLQNNYQTLSFFVYITSLGPNACAFLYAVGGNANGVSIGWLTDSVRFFISNGASNLNYPVSMTNALNTWMNITCIIDNVNRTMTAYKNGSLVGTSSQWSAFTPPSSAVTIGNNSMTGNTGDFIKGRIANVQVYNRSLTATEISQNYESDKTRFGL
jgi:hypothetical protein